MRWRDSILTLIIPPLLSLLPCSVQAASSLALLEKEAFQIPVLLQEKPLTTYAVKIRFSNHATKCEPECEGQTWNGTTWLSQSSAWTTFPSFTTNASGQASLTVFGEAPDTRDFSYVQLALRDMATEKVEVVENYSITWLTAPHALMLEAYDSLGTRYTQGTFRILHENGNERLLPLLNQPSLITAVAERVIYIQFMLPDGTSLGEIKSYRLTENGLFKIQINPPPTVSYQPRLRLLPRLLIPDEPQSILLETTTPYNDTVRWYQNGEIIPANQGQQLVLSFSKSGAYTVVAELANGEVGELGFTIQPLTAIQIEKILPNPSGRDTKQEEIMLHNRYSFPVTLSKWQLRSRTSNRTFTFSTPIDANQTASVVASNFLINDEGIYDLYSSDGLLIDTFHYTQAQAGEYFIKSGLQWVPEHPRASVATSTMTTNDLVSVVGTVTKPSGSTIDIVTDSGEAIRLVIHSSYPLVKPKLHKGDRVAATGVWRRSRRGPYLSIRANGSFRLVATTTQIKSTATKKKSNPIKRVFVETASAKIPEVISRAPPQKPEQLSASPPFQKPPPDSLRWLISVIITFGVLLIFPEKRNSV